jgi:hypothetical protein
MKKSSILIKPTIVSFTLCILAISFQSCNEKPKEKETPVDKFDLTIAKAEIEEANSLVAGFVAAGDSHWQIRSLLTHNL